MWPALYPINSIRTSWGEALGSCIEIKTERKKRKKHLPQMTLMCSQTYKELFYRRLPMSGF
jgi:hypothetical protein